MEDVELPEIGWWWGIPRFIFGRLDQIFRLNTGYIVRLLLPENRRRLGQYDWIVAVTTTHALAFGMMQRLGIIQGKVLAVTTGLVENFEKEWQWTFARWILGKCHLVSLSRGEAAEMGRRLGRPVRYIPFGVDEDFWRPLPQGKRDPSEAYALSVGNDRQRDFDLLVKVWRPEWPKLKLLTMLPLNLRGKENIEQIRGDWHEAAVTDEGLRCLYQKSRFVVVPVKNVWQPSGQSVTLQAMACGKAVVLARTDGLWDEAIMKDGKNVALYPAENGSELEQVLQRLLEENGNLKEIEMNARDTVKQAYSIREWSRELEGIVR